MPTKTILSNHENISIIAYGNHDGIIQSILDFDYLCGKNTPSIVAIISSTNKYYRYFWGGKEVLLPVYKSLGLLPGKLVNQINAFINFSSNRRMFQTTTQLIETLPYLKVGTLLAEGMPEKDALELDYIAHHNNIIIFGPASIGLLIPGIIKLGPIGGTQHHQLISSRVFIRGKIAVLSASGGMANEIINILSQYKQPISIALSFGGDRYPIASPKEMFQYAQDDPTTEYIVYYGELGGVDEYEVAEIIKNKQITKPVIAYIAGTAAQLFEKPFQFGHAKAIAQTKSETAQEKRLALKKAGAKVADSFGKFIDILSKIPHSLTTQAEHQGLLLAEKMDNRIKALFTSTISKDDQSGVKILGDELINFASNNSFSQIVASLFLGKKKVSREFEQFVDIVLKLLVDHGPLVSGAVNSIITARAGKDLVSSLVAGLLTIGPRFGGVINSSANNWFEAVRDKVDPNAFVENYAKNHIPIPGIGHKKYNLYEPDPRVLMLVEYGKKLSRREYYNFGKSIEAITTAKKSNLILNIDGTIAATMLDILVEKDKLSEIDIKILLDSEFFNAFFILARSVGFIAHVLDQKRLDEGLFRLPNELNNYVEL